jgi:Ca-activated chloride channel family protein
MGGFAMPPRLRNPLALAAFALLLAPTWGRGQGIIIDRRPHIPLARAFEIREVTVDARVRDQVAEVQVSQTFHNPGSWELESEYLFPMPDDGAIQNFVLMVDGRELPGRLLPKEEARRIYEEVVRSKRDPALLEYMGRGLFRTSVFPIPPGADRKVTLRYTQLLRRDRDVVEFTYPFGTQKFTAKPIQRLSLTMSIDSRDPIKSLYSPSHDVEIRRSGDYQANIRLVQHDITPTTDFRLVYTLSDGALGASVLSYRPSESDDGYFLLLASPKVRPPDARPQPKTVVFVLDRSGSMSGKKIEQARNALKFVLDNLRDDDLFNIVAYDDRVETYKPELQRYSRDARSEAVRFVENIQPGGSTNIDGALRTALGLLQDDSRPNYVLFLTDGLPTAGETRENAIAENGRSANKAHARLFAFGVGHDVNARLLDRLSGGNGGASEYVRPDEDIEAHVSRFYSKLTSPALTGISIEMASTDLNRTYPRDVPDLFEGGQLVWVGRYRQSGRTEVVVRGKVGGERQEFRFPAELAGAGRGTAYDFVERLWAVRRVGFIIDQVDLHGKSRELVDELVALSTKYGILTPYTSFLADERVRLYDRAANSSRALESLDRLGEVNGSQGVGQRANKQAYLSADKAVATEAEARSALRSEAAPSAPAAPAAGPAGAGGYAYGGVRSGGASGRPLSGNQAGLGNGLGRGRGMGGRPGEVPAIQAPNAPARGAQMTLAKDAEGNAIAVANVRQLGNKTFYRRNGRWVDSEVKPEDEAKATDIEQFSDDYFRLARAQDAQMNQYLTFEEPVTVNLNGRVYRINVAKP